MKEDKEARIEIEGVTLSFGQSMSVRVAVESFLMELNDPEFRDGLGPVAKGYQDRLSEVRALIAKGVR